MKHSFSKTSRTLLWLAWTAGTFLGANAQTAGLATGLPSPSSEVARSSRLPLIQEWKALGDSAPILPECFYDGLALDEIVKDLRETFRKQKAELHIVTPKDAVISKSGMSVQSVPVSLHLRNLNATEIFNAMNLFFDIEKVPLRWELTVNGRRPTAVLHLLEADNPHPPSAEAPRTVEPMVIWVGHLMGDQKTGKLSIDEIARTLLETYTLAYGKEGADSLIQVHKGAELIVIRGNQDQVRFVTNALSALKQKVENRVRMAGPSAREFNASPGKE